MEKVPMTKEGYVALKAELQRLKGPERVAVSREIETARDHGDLKENAEYHAAKEKQGLMEARIAEIEDRLSRAEVIDTSKLSGDRAAFGAWVTLEDLERGDVVTYRIVGADEANLDEGTISVTAPMARALINREAGDEVIVKAPGGVRSYEIAEVSWEPPQ
jgi:transcription elongation factor GreA